jgi:predicted MPP superfamily phosphohydrolase
MAGMVFAPLVVHLAEKAGHDIFARGLSFTGYTWMGVLFLFFSSSLAIDLYRLLISLSGMILRADLSLFSPSKKAAFLIAFYAAFAASIYGYFEALDIRTERVRLETPKIPAEAGVVRIVQISDVHLGLIVREERLKRILDAVMKESPDLLVSTGDLVDGQIDDLTELVSLLAAINPRYGKFAVTGNHEFYAGLDQSLDFTSKAGFRVLRGERVAVGGFMTIAGVDDPAGRWSGRYKGMSEIALLSGIPRDTFTLLLKHRPLVDPGAVGIFDLQLSGHVHKGQIFPFSLITKIYYPIHAGEMKFRDRSFLYVSRGSGTWGPPIRLLSPPEVTVIELVPTRKQQQ